MDEENIQPYRDRVEGFNETLLALLPLIEKWDAVFSDEALDELREMSTVCLDEPNSTRGVLLERLEWFRKYIDAVRTMV